MTIPPLDFTYLYNLLQFRENFYRTISGNQFRVKDFHRNVQVHFLGIIGMIVMSLEKFLISIYSLHFVNTICNCLIHIMKSFQKVYNCLNAKRIPYSGVQLNLFYIIPKLKFTRILTLRNEIKYQHYKDYLEKINNDFLNQLHCIYKIFYFSFLRHMTCPILMT